MLLHPSARYNSIGRPGHVRACTANMESMSYDMHGQIGFATAMYSGSYGRPSVCVKLFQQHKVASSDFRSFIGKSYKTLLRSVQKVA